MNGFVKFLLILVILTTLGNLVNQVILWAPPVVDSETAGGNGNGTGDNNNQPGGNEETEVQKPIADVQISATVTPDADGKVPAGGVSMNGETASATVPEGVQMEEGATELTLTVNGKEDSEADLDLSENEVSTSLDVHMAGVASDNAIPMEIKLAAAAVKGLNSTSIKLYHVENGETVEMTRVANGEAFTEHNQFKYDPATGDVTLYMSSFSEVAFAIDTENAWEGEFDYTWYDADATELTIANAEQLAAFGAIVGGMAKDENGNFLITYTDSDNDEHHNDSFSGKTVKLLADVNLGDAEDSNNEDIIFYPIGYWNNEGTYERLPAEQRVNAVSSGFYAFEGTFDGNGNTISNFYQNTWEMKGDHNWYSSVTEQYFRDGMGLFGKVYGGTVKNLTVENFSSDGEITTTGVIAAYADSANGKPATFENISITNCNPRVYNIGNGGIVGCAGWYSRNESLGNADYTNAVTFRNITVDQTNKISALWGTYDVSCGGILGQYYPDSECGIKMEKCHVAAKLDVHNDVCANYQYYWYRYSGMFIGTVRANTTDANGYTVADTTGITATDCTYTLGDWNQYWYCELVKNSLASYTHDHQFSRLTTISSLSEIQDKNGNWNKEGNFVIPAADNTSAQCYHIFKNSEGNLYQHFHDVADESNPNIYESKDINGDGELNDLKEDRQCYFMPFNQVMNGLGYGVKSHYEFPGITQREDNLVTSVEKFEALDTLPTYRPGTTITLGQLVNAIVDESKISTATLYVAVSPAINNDNTKVSATYSLDTGDWANSTITFGADCSGAVKIVITDYFYCTPTVIVINEEGKSAKFEANNVSEQNAYTQITLGDLFTAVSGKTIGNVTATVTDPNGNETTVTGTSSDWATKTIDLTKDGTWMVSIIDDDKYCEATTATFTVNKVNKFVNKFTNDFLYRVGNANAFDIGYIFGENITDYPVGLSSVNVTITNVAGNVTYTLTDNTIWTKREIQFSDTGVVEVTISAEGAKSVSVKLEVVTAVNAIKATSATANNVVLLQDISGTFSVSGGYTVYGNGFTVTLPTDSSSTWKAGFVGYITLNGGNLDNIQINGPVYPVVNIYRTQAGDESSGCTYFYNSVIITGGDCKITNSYISGSRAAIYVKAGNSVVIDNTTVSCGTYANIEIAAAIPVTLKNLTTIQKETVDSYNQGNSMIGMGVVVSDSGAVVTIEGELNQYNWVTKAQWDAMIPDAYANQFPDLFGSSYTEYQHDYNGTTYINLAMIFACAWNPDVQIDDNRTNTELTYTKKNISIANTSGGVYSITGATLTDDLYNAPTYSATTQGVFSPKTVFDHTTKNNEPETSGSNVYCYYNATDGKYLISFDDGGSRAWEYDILTVTKGSNTFPYNVSVSGNAVVNSNNTITFSEAGDYTVTFTYTDNLNYALNNGEIITYSVTYEKYVYITVFEVEPEADPTTFAFGSNGYTSVSAGGVTYVMPNVTGTKDPTISSSKIVTSSGIGSTTVNGETIYYPIIGMHKVGNKYTGYYNYFSVFEAVTINDADGSTVYNTSTTSLPSNNLSVIGGFILDSSGNVSTSESANGTSIFNYSTGKAIATASVTVEGSSVGLCYYPNSKFTSSTTSRDEQTIVVKYCYTDTNGKMCYYYIGYWCASGSNGVQAADSCVSGDTLVTLADGTQKRIDEVTYEDKLLVWNFFEGKYDVVPSAIIYYHGDEIYEILKLNFDDGTTVKVINNHGFFDMELNKFVFITQSNVDEYVGHSFAKVDGENRTTVKLVSYEITEEYTGCYSIETVQHKNFMVEGMFSLTIPYYEGWFDYFEIGEGMKYDEAKMQADIDKYGLYTYEDFVEYDITYEQFIAFNGPYLKVLVGRGTVTFEQIIYLIETVLHGN